MPQDKRPTVYSTDPNFKKRCKKCGRYPCRCPKPYSLPPNQQTAALYRERKGRGGKTVTVIYRKADFFGRLIGTVRVSHRNVNLEMVHSGWAWNYRRYSRDPALDQAESRARAARAGLWSHATPIPPWVYRKQSRKPPNTSPSR